MRREPPLGLVGTDLITVGNTVTERLSARDRMAGREPAPKPVVHDTSVQVEVSRMTPVPRCIVGYCLDSGANLVQPDDYWSPYRAGTVKQTASRFDAVASVARDAAISQCYWRDLVQACQHGVVCAASF